MCYHTTNKFQVILTNYIILPTVVTDNPEDLFASTHRKKSAIDTMILLFNNNELVIE